MYQPSQFVENRPEVLRSLVQAHPLGTLVTVGPDGLRADHIPFLIEDDGDRTILRAHVARANPLWRDIAADTQALVIFQGPSRYITPSWYATKRETGKVVPTYNYMVVHAHGTLRAIDDPAWVRSLVERLTDHFESGRSAPWAVSDAPDEFVTQQLRAVVGIELPVTRIEGKWKVSQNRPAADRAGVVEGLRETGDPAAEVMASAVEAHAPKDR